MRRVDTMCSDTCFLRDLGEAWEREWGGERTPLSEEIAVELMLVLRVYC
jgi:hypothetical protein